MVFFFTAVCFPHEGRYSMHLGKKERKGASEIAFVETRQEINSSVMKTL